MGVETPSCEWARTKSYFCHEAGGEEAGGPIPLNMYIPLLHINNVKQI